MILTDYIVMAFGLAVFAIPHVLLYGAVHANEVVTYAILTSDRPGARRMRESGSS